MARPSFALATRFMKRPRIKTAVVFGTRPEAIKLAPVIRVLRARPATFETRIFVTAQHREMLDQVLNVFELAPDQDLDLMRPGQSLAGFASLALDGLDALFRKVRPELVVVQGDTSTAFVAALAGFYNRAKIAHVEAGLRSFDRLAPYPEEINRTLVGQLANLHFAPTEHARENLLREGVDDSSIFVTGNTVVDALLEISSRLESGQVHPPLAERLRQLPARYVLITAHRRESHGQGLINVFRAVRDLEDRLPDFHFVFPVHLSPAVQGPAWEILGALPRVHLLPPTDYVSFVWLVKHCRLILSDSGGVQEEAPSLRKPVLVLREVTERPEALDSGWARLVGINQKRIVEAVLSEVWCTPDDSARKPNPFGDGHAAERIVDILGSPSPGGHPPARARNAQAQGPLRREKSREYA